MDKRKEPPDSVFSIKVLIKQHLSGTVFLPTKGAAARTLSSSAMAASVKPSAEVLHFSFTDCANLPKYSVELFFFRNRILSAIPLPVIAVASSHLGLPLFAESKLIDRVKKVNPDHNFPIKISVVLM
ncbi:hypothetical protein N9L26_02745 [Candidatus Pacebacteria bacterium]|nr:hypothetical protein [Candidatus Paceibacterota bacterium]